MYEWFVNLLKTGQNSSYFSAMILGYKFMYEPHLQSLDQLMCVAQVLIDEGSELVLVMAWCQLWPRIAMSYGITGPQWV